MTWVILCLTGFITWIVILVLTFRSVKNLDLNPGAVAFSLLFWPIFTIIVVFVSIEKAILHFSRKKNL